MRVLVIPDVHLKPWMFQRASALTKQHKADQVICLMDIADDWHCQYNLELYEQTYDAAIQFAREYPKSLWCYGNHDVCYVWNQRESGYSKIAPYTVCTKLDQLRKTLDDPSQLAFIHRIDNVLFMHGGLIDYYVQVVVQPVDYNDTDAIVNTINTYGYSELWNDYSPIWYRPQYSKQPLYLPDRYLQVVGHTPVKKITQTANLISCDNFSTDQRHNPIGEQKFLLLDTKTWKWDKI